MLSEELCMACGEPCVAVLELNHSGAEIICGGAGRGGGGGRVRDSSSGSDCGGCGGSGRSLGGSEPVSERGGARDSGALACTVSAALAERSGRAGGCGDGCRALCL
jgi:hypothetical protein